MGRTILEHSRGPRTDLGQQAEVPRGVPRAAAEVGIPVDAILGNLDQQTNLARSNAVRHRTTSRVSLSVDNFGSRLIVAG